jgi:hypothetical protein
VGPEDAIQAGAVRQAQGEMVCQSVAQPEKLVPVCQACGGLPPVNGQGQRGVFHHLPGQRAAVAVPQMQAAAGILTVGRPQIVEARARGHGQLRHRVYPGGEPQVRGPGHTLPGEFKVRPHQQVLAGQSHLHQ